MTYCVGILLEHGLVLASDSRTHAGVDNFAKFCKMSVFEREGDRVLVLLSSGNLAGTQAVISTLKQRAERKGDAPNLWTARTMFDFVTLVSDTIRDVERRDRAHLEQSGVKFDASFIIGGQIKGEAPRLFRTYAEGNFVEAGAETQFFQTGEAKYGKPIIDRVLRPDTSLSDATIEKRIRQAVDRMQPDQRQAFILFEFDGLTGKEVAKIGGRSLPATLRRRYEAQRVLQEALKSES